MYAMDSEQGWSCMHEYKVAPGRTNWRGPRTYKYRESENDRDQIKGNKYTLLLEVVHARARAKILDHFIFATF